MATQLATQQDSKQSTIPLSQLKEMGFHSGPAFGLLRSTAEFLMKSDIIPKQFQGNIANCAVALNMAQRMGADPLMVMQSLYVVYGRPSWSAQFLIATMNTTGEFSKLRYEWSDEKDKTKDKFGCRAFAVEKETGETLYGPWVTVGLARAEGWYDRKSKDGGVASKWPTLTELMCTYRAAAFFVRTYCPEIAMGMRMSDEEEEIHAATNITGQAQELGRTHNMPPSYPGTTSEQAQAQEPQELKAEEPKPPIPPQAASSPAPKASQGPKKNQPAAPTTQAAAPTYGEIEEDPFKSGELKL